MGLKGLMLLSLELQDTLVRMKTKSCKVGVCVGESREERALCSHGSVNFKI